MITIRATRLGAAASLCVVSFLVPAVARPSLADGCTVPRKLSLPNALQNTNQAMQGLRKVNAAHERAEVYLRCVADFLDGHEPGEAATDAIGVERDEFTAQLRSEMSEWNDLYAAYYDAAVAEGEDAEPVVFMDGR